MTGHGIGAWGALSAATRVADRIAHGVPRPVARRQRRSRTGCPDRARARARHDPRRDHPLAEGPPRHDGRPRRRGRRPAKPGRSGGGTRGGADPGPPRPAQMTARRPMRVNLQARATAAEQRRARTRERLLDAAERVIAERGMEAASIDAFVAAAGVSRGTFYNYFPTVTDLLHAMNSRLAEDLDRRVDGLTGPIEDCAVRLAAFIHVVMASSLVDPVSGWVGLQVAGP